MISVIAVGVVFVCISGGMYIFFGVLIDLFIMNRRGITDRCTMSAARSADNYEKF